MAITPRDKKMADFEKEIRARMMLPLDKVHADTQTPDLNENPGQAPHTNDFMTIEKYVSNPTGKGSAYVANRNAIKQGLNITYIKLLREHRKAFYAMPFIYPNGDMIFYVKVPSEDYKNNKISYDVLFLIKYDDKLKRANRHMFLYSNSPSFIYTYCYVYNQKGLLIDKLKSKLPQIALTKFPEVRNPIGSLGYEKSTYIAARYLIDGKCLSDEYVNRYSKTMTDIVESQTFAKIADPELLVSIYQHAQYKQRKEHRKELSAKEKMARDQRNKQYEEEQRKNRPKEGFLVRRAPRAKITARQAQKSLSSKKK